MSGFFSDDELKNPGAGEVWKRSEVDRALDEYFPGADPEQLGIKYKGAPRAFLKSILEKLEYNYKKKGKEDQPGRAERYEPFCRVSRKGKRFTPNELKFNKSHRRLGLDPAVTAKILCRSVSEILALGDTKSEAKAHALKEIVPSLDLVLAYRYAFHVYKKSLIADHIYDALKAEEMEFGGNAAALASSACPQRIKTLAAYLCELQEDEVRK